MAASAPIPSVVVAPPAGPEQAAKLAAPSMAAGSTFAIPVSSPSSRPETPLLPSRSAQPCPGVAAACSGPHMRPPPGLVLPPAQPPATYDQPKRRRRTTPHELGVLESAFAKNPMPTQDERALIAASVGMTTRATQIWFQNRRQKEKRDRDQGQAAARPAAPSTPTDEVPDQRPSSAGPMRSIPLTRTMSEPVPRAVAAAGSGGTGTLFDAAGGRVMRVFRTGDVPAARQPSGGSRRLWERMAGSDDVEAPQMTVRGPRPPIHRSNSLDVVASRGSAHYVADKAGRSLRQVDTALANASGMPSMAVDGSSDTEGSDELLTPNTSVSVDPVAAAGKTPMADSEAADLLLSLGGFFGRA